MKRNNKINFYQYLRKSSEEGNLHVQSIERQQDEINKLIKRLG